MGKKKIQIIKEDILRTIGEKKTQSTFSYLQKEIGIKKSILRKIAEELIKEQLLRKEEEEFSLTEKGEAKINNLLKKHFALENYYKKSKGEKEAHLIAHALEHYISQEVIDKIKRLDLLKDKGQSLIRLNSGGGGIISDFEFSDFHLFERIVSMGIFPGEELFLFRKINDGIVIGIKNKKFAIDKTIAKKIKLVKNDE